MNRPTPETLRRVASVRQSLDRRVGALMLSPDEKKFWRVFELYQRACAVELRIVERSVGKQLR